MFFTSFPVKVCDCPVRSREVKIRVLPVPQDEEGQSGRGEARLETEAVKTPSKTCWPVA